MKKHLIGAAAMLCAALSSQAQTSKPDGGASMVKPPGTPGAPSADAARPNNPDNMPVKRPDKPLTGDRMLHHSPASDAIAK